MGRRAARATHLGLSVLGAALYFLFIIPRWWVLTGDFPATLGTVGRIAAGVPVAAAAVPVMVHLQRSLTAVPKPPELALRLRAWSAVLHVIAGILIIATAIAEIWLSLQVAGPWLFGVYGAAGAIAVLGMLAFTLSFTAEKPPAPPKPAKVEAEKVKAEKPKKEKRSRERAGTTVGGDDTSEAETPEEPTEGEAAEDASGGPAGEDTEPSTADTIADDAGADDAVDDEAVADDSAQNDETTAPAPGGLLNQRPSGKKRHRLRR